MRVLLIWCLLAGAALAEGERSGKFDYYVMALSWSPNWCAIEGDARDAEQCEARHDYGWILHGLWPQFHRGYPSFCPTTARAPSRRMTRDMTDIMGSGGLAWHQWKKHGVCAGVSASDYYALSREAYGKVTRPGVFRQLEESVKVPPKVVEAAFLKENEGLEADGITVTCRDGHIQEVRICLSKDLDFVPCGGDVVRDCRAERAIFDPVR